LADQFVGAEIAVAIGVERGPVIVPIVGMVISVSIKAARPIAILELALADAAVVVCIPIAVGTGAVGIPFVAAGLRGDSKGEPFLPKPRKRLRAVSSRTVQPFRLNGLA